MTSPKRDERVQASSYVKSRPKSYHGQLWKRTDDVINRRVVVFNRDDSLPNRGTIRYIGEEKDRNGKMQTIIGLELVRNYD